MNWGDYSVYGANLHANYMDFKPRSIWSVLKTVLELDVEQETKWFPYLKFHALFVIQSSGF